MNGVKFVFFCEKGVFWRVEWFMQCVKRGWFTEGEVENGGKNGELEG